MYLVIVFLLISTLATAKPTTYHEPLPQIKQHYMTMKGEIDYHTELAKAKTFLLEQMVKYPPLCIEWIDSMQYGTKCEVEIEENSINYIPLFHAFSDIMSKRVKEIRKEHRGSNALYTIILVNFR